MNKKILIRIFLYTIVFIVCFMFLGCNKSVAMTNYYKLDFATALVTASSLHVRQGPGTGFKSIGMVYKNQYIRVFAGIGDWYVVQTDNDLIGAVNKNYVKAIKPGSTSTPQATATPKPTPAPTQNTGTTQLTEDEREVFNLVNAERRKAGLSDLKIDSELQNIARLKAQEMVDQNYFSHTSPTYGSPFDMMKKFEITYKTAGENIAGNSSNSGAVNAWMNSEGHRANILNSSFNYTGIGVANGSKYGKIYVQMFIGR